MRKIRLEDVLDLTAYEKQRAGVRPRIMEVKKPRRIHVGPKILYLFETYDTMWYQVQEMTRAERIVDDDGIMAEINVYNELIPEKNQLCASLMIEIDDVDERKSFLSKIVDLPEHTFLVVDGQRIQPEFDPRQGSEDKLSSVQYIKYSLSETQVVKFEAENAIIKFEFDHELYSYEYELTKEQKRLFVQDMRAD